MRTTVVLDDDVAAAVEQLRQDRRLGLSEALNTLVRAGLREPRRTSPAPSFEPAALGMRFDVSNVAEVLEQLDDAGPPA